MTTDPNRPSDPMPPNPNDPMPPSGPPPIPPPGQPPTTPPPTTPPPVGEGDPYGQPAPASGSAPAQPTGGGTSPPPAGGTGFTPSPAGTSGTSMSLDRSKLSTYDMALAATPVVFLIALLLPWVSISAEGLPGLGESSNGFGSGLLTFAWILLIAAAVLAVLPAMGTNVKLPFPRGLVLLGLTGLAAILTLIALIDVLGAGDDLGVPDSGIDVSTGIGAWLGMLVALVAVALAFLVFRSEQTGHTVAA